MRFVRRWAVHEIRISLGMQTQDNDGRGLAPDGDLVQHDSNTNMAEGSADSNASPIELGREISFFPR